MSTLGLNPHGIALGTDRQVVVFHVILLLVSTYYKAHIAMCFMLNSSGHLPFGTIEFVGVIYWRLILEPCEGLMAIPHP